MTDHRGHPASSKGPPKIFRSALRRSIANVGWAVSIEAAIPPAGRVRVLRSCDGLDDGLAERLRGVSDGRRLAGD